MLLSIANFIAINAVELCIGIAATWLLPVRHRALFLTLMVLFPLTVAHVFASPETLTIANILGFLINYVVLPICFWDAPALWRATAAILLLITEFMWELVTALIFLGLGIPLNRDLNTVPHLIVRILNIAAFLIIARVLSRVFRRLSGRAQQKGPGDGPVRLARENLIQAGRQTGRYLLFLGPQLLFLAGATMLLMMNRKTVAEVYIAVLSVNALCFAVDILVLSSLKRYTRSRASRERAHVLEDQLEVHIEGVRVMRAEAEQAARFRHDIRNHLQVVGTLLDSGRVARARAYIAALRERLASARRADPAPEEAPQL